MSEPYTAEIGQLDFLYRTVRIWRVLKEGKLTLSKHIVRPAFHKYQFSVLQYIETRLRDQIDEELSASDLKLDLIFGQSEM